MKIHTQGFLTHVVDLGHLYLIEELSVEKSQVYMELEALLEFAELMKMQKELSVEESQVYVELVALLVFAELVRVQNVWMARIVLIHA